MLKRIPRRIKLWWWRLTGKTPKWMRYVSCTNCHEAQWVSEKILRCQDYNINSRSKRKMYGTVCQYCGKFLELYSVPKHFHGNAVPIEKGES